MKKVRIGITTVEVPYNTDTWAPNVYGQAKTYINAVIGAGAIPVLLPIIGDEDTLRGLYELCDGIVFAGGNDIDPSLYGEEKSDLLYDKNDLTKGVSEKRDGQELQLLQWSLEDDKPILGICRGMQLLNVCQGGTLYQDIYDAIPGVSNHRSSVDAKDVAFKDQKLKIEPNSKLATILGATEVPTNHMHHQAINKLGDDLVATAWTDDGIVEAVEAPNHRFVVAVQSHPEALATHGDEQWAKIFTEFVRSVGVNQPQPELAQAHS
jgi:putative glutamine amidotransferase